MTYSLSFWCVFTQELQDQIDELQSELEEYRVQGRVCRPSLESSLHEEFDITNGGRCDVEPDQGKGYFL